MGISPEKGSKSGWLAGMRKRRTTMQQAQAALDEAIAAARGGGPGLMTRYGISLADLKPGECGYIGRLEGNTQGRLRLMELGLTPGVHVQVIRIAAFGGPLDIEVRGYQLSLRREEAAAVLLGDKNAARLAGDLTTEELP